VFYSEGVRKPGDEAIILDLAHDLVKAIFDKELSREDKRALCQASNNLRLPMEADDDKVHAVNLLVKTVGERHVLKDKSSKSALAKFEGALGKRYAKQLEDFNEEHLRKMDDLKKLFAFLDEVEDEGEEDFDIDRRPLKRERSDSMFSTTDEDVSRASTSAMDRNSRSRGKASKRPRVSTDASGSEYGNSRRSVKRESATPPPEPPPVKLRTQPKRAAAGALKPEVIIISSDEEPDVISPPRKVQPKPKKPPSASMSSGRKSSTADDPIVIKEDDDSEGEVNSLLVAD
jgi:condensin complex subunit 3